MFKPTSMTNKKKEKKKKNPVKASQGNILTGRTQELEGSIKYYTEQLCKLRMEKEIIEWLIENPERADLTALDLQRYGADRFPETWWWCHPDLDEVWDVGEDMPKAEDYHWGNYWSGFNKDVERYVIDRAKWRVPGLEFEINQAEERLKNLSGKMW